MQTKAKCDDQNAKNSYHRAIANELGHRFETTNYTCCSTSCCYPDLTDLQSETKTTSGTINKKENTEVQLNAKNSDSTGIKISKNWNVIPLAHLMETSIEHDFQQLFYYLLPESTKKSQSGPDSCYDTSNDPLVCYTCSDITNNKCSTEFGAETRRTSAEKPKCNYRFAETYIFCVLIIM